jgi:hypothetical protein
LAGDERQHLGAEAVEIAHADNKHKRINQNHNKE